MNAHEMGGGRASERAAPCMLAKPLVGGSGPHPCTTPLRPFRARWHADARGRDRDLCVLHGLPFPTRRTEQAFRIPGRMASSDLVLMSLSISSVAHSASCASFFAVAASCAAANSYAWLWRWNLGGATGCGGTTASSMGAGASSTGAGASASVGDIPRCAWAQQVADE